MDEIQKDWKTKAGKRREENEALKKRLEELTISRNIWQHRFRKMREMLKNTNAKNKKLKKELESSKKKIILDGEKPRRYWYSYILIQWLLLCKIQTSASFRAISYIIKILIVVVQMENRTPCYNTVRMWLLKLGYYELKKEYKKCDEMVIIIDGSIQFGKEKMYLIYGIPQSEIPLNRALKLNDLKVLYMQIKETWNGEIVFKELQELKSKVGKIVYAVSDKGSELAKGLRLAGIPQIHDITHKLALLLEKMFSEDKSYKSITTEMSTMRSQLSQTEAAFIVPNAQRKKSFYQNMKIISDWLVKFYRFVESKKYEEKLLDRKEKLEWVLEKKEFIQKFDSLNTLICNIEKILKTKGLSNNTKIECINLFNQISHNDYVDELKKEFITYADEMLSKVTYERILCTSDIIETSFGKYKNYVGSNPMSGITNLSLCLAAFTSDFSKETIKNALESTTISDIEKWTKDNIKETILKKRREAFHFT